MKKIPLTQGKFALVDNEDYDFLSQWKWYYKKGYAVRHLKNRHIYMHRLLAKTLVGEECDHINLDRLDNRRLNLRNCSHSQNMANKRKLKAHKKISFTSKFIGIHKIFTGKWQATLQFNKKKLYLGIFTSETEAAKARDVKAKELFKDFAQLNLGLNKQ